MSRDFKIALWILIPVVVAGLVYWPLSPGGRQTINRRIARQHIPQVQAILDKDARYAAITLFAYTGQDGALGLGGTVNSEDALCELMQAVANEKLPVPVAWLIEVRPER